MSPTFVIYLMVEQPTLVQVPRDNWSSVGPCEMVVVHCHQLLGQPIETCHWFRRGNHTGMRQIQRHRVRRNWCPNISSEERNLAFSLKILYKKESLSTPPPPSTPAVAATAMSSQLKMKYLQTNSSSRPRNRFRLTLKTLGEAEYVSSVSDSSFLATTVRLALK